MAACAATIAGLPHRARCDACGSRFAWTNLLVNTGLAAMKATVGMLTHSEALVVSSLYSINDVLSAAAVITSLRMSHRSPSARHPFGYGKVEFLAVGAVSVVLAASVCFFTYEMVRLFGGHQTGSPSLLAAGVALFALVTSGVLARRGFCVAKNLDSPALHTSAEHNRADALSSAAVLVGLGGAAMGLPVLDRLVAVFEALDIMRLAGALLGQSLQGLMDAALPSRTLEVLRRASLQVPGVLEVGAIRSRRSGSVAWVDIVVEVAPGQTVEQAHQVTRRVHALVREVVGQRARAQVGFRAHGRHGATVQKAGAHA